MDLPTLCSPKTYLVQVFATDASHTVHSCSFACFYFFGFPCCLGLPVDMREEALHHIKKHVKGVLRQAL